MIALPISLAVGLAFGVFGLRVVALVAALLFLLISLAVYVRGAALDPTDILVLTASCVIALQVGYIAGIAGRALKMGAARTKASTLGVSRSH